MKEIRQIVQANQLQRIEQWHRVEAATINTDGYGARPIVVRLRDLWWLGYRDNYGRSGHSYTAPFLMTVSMWILRLRGVDAFWSAYYPNLQAPGEQYEPANIIYQPKGRQHGVEIRCLFPDRLVIAEHKLRDRLFRLKHHVRT